DRLGPLLTLNGNADVPYGELLARPATLAERGMSLPFELHASVPRRKLSKLPPILSTAGLAGELELRVDVHDTIRTPDASVQGVARGLQASGRRRGVPV